MVQSPTTPISDVRREYQLAQLDEADVAADAIEQFGRWYSDAEKAQVPELTAMTLATADEHGVPSARIVLLKGFDVTGFVFYTNRQSQKGRELAANPRAALVLFWEPLERQIRISGTVERLSVQDSSEYFRTRPIKSKIGAWVSQQSHVLTTRDELTRKEAELSAKFAGQEVPMPEYWGGYRVLPQTIEFWQGRRSRLHDRLRYSRGESGWKIERLAP